MQDDIKGAFEAFFSPLFDRVRDCKVAVDFGNFSSATVTINMTPKHTIKATLWGVSVASDGQLAMNHGYIASSVLWHRKERYDFPVFIGKCSHGRFADTAPDMIARLVRVAMLCAVGRQRYNSRKFKRVSRDNEKVLIHGIRQYGPLQHLAAANGEFHFIDEDIVIEAMAVMPFDRISRAFGLFGFQVGSLVGEINRSKCGLGAVPEAGFDPYFRNLEKESAASERFGRIEA